MLSAFRRGLLLATCLLTGGAAFAGPATLRAELPQDAVAYLRLPFLGGQWDAGELSAIQPAMTHPTMRKAQEDLRVALVKMLRENEDKLLHPALAMLLADVCSPLELALLPAPADFQGPPIPNALLSAELCYTEGKNFQARLEEVTKNTPAEIIDLKQPLNEQGTGLAILNGQMPLVIQWQADRNRLLLLSGPSAPAIDVPALASGMKAADHRMHEVETRLESSGAGLFVWIDGQRGVSLMRNMMPPQIIGMLEATGLNQAKAIALGLGTANKKGRLSLAVDMPPVGMRQAIPLIDAKYNLSVAGKPGAVLALALPSSAQLRTIAAIASRGDTSQYDEFNKKIAEYSGVTLDETLDALGPEMLAFSDEAGEYVAFNLRNAAGFKTLLDKMTERLKLTRKSFERNGHTYHSLYVPQSSSAMNTMMDLDEPPFNTEAFKFWIGRVMKANAHNYWTQHGDYVVFALTPQSLYEFVEHKERTVLKDWAINSLRQDPSNSLIFTGGEISDAPRRLYSVFIDAFTTLAEITGAEIDPFAFPTATELKLADSSTVALQLTSGTNGLSVEIAYDASPVDMLYGWQPLAVAMAGGNLFSIGYNSFMDYMMAEMEEMQRSLEAMDADPTADAVEAAEPGSPGAELAAMANYSRMGTDYLVSTNEAFPADATGFEELGLETEGEFVAGVALVANAENPLAGTLVISFKTDVDEAYAGKTLQYERDAEGNWSCAGGTLEQELRPADCQ